MSRLGRFSIQTAHSCAQEVMQMHPNCAETCAVVTFASGLNWDVLFVGVVAAKSNKEIWVVCVVGSVLLCSKPHDPLQHKLAVLQIWIWGVSNKRKQFQVGVGYSDSESFQTGNVSCTQFYTQVQELAESVFVTVLCLAGIRVILRLSARCLFTRACACVHCPCAPWSRATCRSKTRREGENFYLIRVVPF